MKRISGGRLWAMRLYRRSQVFKECKLQSSTGNDDNLLQRKFKSYSSSKFQVNLDDSTPKIANTNWYTHWKKKKKERKKSANGRGHQSIKPVGWSLCRFRTAEKQSCCIWREAAWARSKAPIHWAALWDGLHWHPKLASAQVKRASKVWQWQVSRVCSLRAAAPPDERGSKCDEATLQSYFGSNWACEVPASFESSLARSEVSYLRPTARSGQSICPARWLEFVELCCRSWIRSQHKSSPSCRCLGELIAAASQNLAPSRPNQSHSDALLFFHICFP